ncbi:hypothetical protein Bbelb_282130 [Branchiostoma belcheri]|nr:hypothetical protein Bbelb_282130 [Branchiostoma belcheri]
MRIMFANGLSPEFITVSKITQLANVSGEDTSLFRMQTGPNGRVPKPSSQKTNASVTSISTPLIGGFISQMTVAHEGDRVQFVEDAGAVNFRFYQMIRISFKVKNRVQGILYKRGNGDCCQAAERTKFGTGILEFFIYTRQLPDPFVDLKSGWKKEEEGMQHWPPTMYGDMAEYLVANGEFRIHMQPCCRCHVQDGPRMGNRGHKQVLYIKTSRMDQAQEERKHRRTEDQGHGVLMTLRSTLQSLSPQPKMVHLCHHLQSSLQSLSPQPRWSTCKEKKSDC